jgi:hypothetical protein
VTMQRHADLPPLEAGFYLYQDVVLGVVSAALGANVLPRPRDSV